ncbi:hypothetical protein [Nonomuraea helvata]|uniref:Uncharacterized protein n=1 Tax=Nonomuraea helvata TaxID=37484 RepID=A0ABV5SG70_9ACTN
MPRSAADTYRGSFRAGLALLVATTADHYVQHAQPDLVIAAIGSAQRQGPAWRRR